MRKFLASQLMPVGILILSATLAIGVYFASAYGQSVPIGDSFNVSWRPGDSIDVWLNKQLYRAPGSDVQIAPMTKKGDSTPGMWQTLTSRSVPSIFGFMLIRSDITPCVSDTARLQGRPGFLEYIKPSEVLNKGGTRATFGYFIKVTQNQLGNLVPTEYFALMSYDVIQPPGTKQNLCAFEFFLFGPTTGLYSEDPPYLVEGLAINGQGRLLASVPFELARVKNFMGDASADEPVTPGVRVEDMGCLRCHGRDDQFPETTLPFPWIKPEQTPVASAKGVKLDYGEKLRDASLPLPPDSSGGTARTFGGLVGALNGVALRIQGYTPAGSIGAATIWVRDPSTNTAASDDTFGGAASASLEIGGKAQVEIDKDHKEWVTLAAQAQPDATYAFTGLATSPDYQKSFRKKVDDEIARVLAELGKPKELSAEQQAALAKPGGGEIFQDRTFTFMGTPQVLRITINRPIASEKQGSRSR